MVIFGIQFDRLKLGSLRRRSDSVSPYALVGPGCIASQTEWRPETSNDTDRFGRARRRGTAVEHSLSRVHA